MPNVIALALAWRRGDRALDTYQRGRIDNLGTPIIYPKSLAPSTFGAGLTSDKC